MFDDVIIFNLYPFFHGGIASMTAEICTYPIDLCKTRLQIQGQINNPVSTSFTYRGMCNVLQKLYVEEGISKLYSGLSAALMRQATYGSIKIGLYHTMKKQSNMYTYGGTFFANLICGVASGIIGAAIANPFDVIKVRLQAGTTLDCNEKLFALFRKMYCREGYRGLYRGVGPSSLRAGIVAGVLLSTYDLFKKIFLQSGYFSDNVHTHLLSGFMAGIVGILLSNPIDVIKSRMMNQLVLQHGRSGSVYSSSIDCLVKTVRTESLFALYRGLVPSYLRLGPWNIIFFISFEQINRISGH